MLREVNFDGLIGPTHHYAGLSLGNVASETNKGSVSHPRAAALQGLSKMKFLMDLGIPQGVVPPQERPHVPTLRRLGFTGSDAQVVERAYAYSPRLVSQVSSASSMWTANAATVAPSCDTADGRVRIIPANLISAFHRSIEAVQTGDTLRRIFSDEGFFAHHLPLPRVVGYGDEGAANHTRLATQPGAKGTHLFVHGRAEEGEGPTKYPARQTRGASEAVARLLRLDPNQCVHARQHPDAIDAGVFHNDVICVGHESVLLFHEQAFVGLEDVLSELRNVAGEALKLVKVAASILPLSEAVGSYLFNSQLITLEDGNLALIAPTECERSERARQAITEILDGENPISTAHYLDVRQSMQNGGGPACLRLRVPLTPQELQAVHAPCLLDDGKYDRLVDWVKRRYREELGPHDLADPALLVESREALDELTAILELPKLYEFQR
jgi:succinylarginine dihydrolase